MRDIEELPAFPDAARWPARGLPESCWPDSTLYPQVRLVANTGSGM